MKWTTSNIKKSAYSNNHVIYFGTRAGSFKKLLPVGEDNPFAHRNLHKLGELDKDSRVTALSYDSNMANILIGRAKPLIQVHSLNSEEVKRSVICDGAPIVGIGYHNNHIIAGIENGQIQCISYNEGTSEKRVKNFGKSGDNINHMRQCPELSTFVATGGKGRQNNLKVFDMSTNGNILFSSKNLPNDNLQLEVPIWDSDVGFLNSPYNLVTCSRYGYVRVYDVRAQRRPVHCYNAEDKLSFSTLASRRNIFCVGTTMGIIELFDIRHMKTFIHKYKGFTGGISDIQLDASGKFLFSACLDRYIRVHHIDTTELMYQCYVKSMPTRLLISESDEATNVINSDELNDSKKYKAAHEKNQITEDKEYEEIFKNLPSIRVGIRHGIYPDEKKYPKCDPQSNNANVLLHYRITISPPTNFLTKNPTIIKHDKHEFLFEGFSLLSHFPLVDLPTCKVIRFNIEYTIQYIAEKMPENFIIRELDLFFKYLFHELLELVDFSLLPNSILVSKETSCPAFHFMPRFVRDLPENGKEVLAMCEVLKYLLDNASPLVDEKRLHCLHEISRHVWQDYVDEFRGMLVTKPGYKPCSVRVDQLDRNISDLPECHDSESGLTHPVIVHFGIRPPQLSYAGNPEYQKAWREYVKFRHLMANMSKPSFKDKRKLEEKEARLQEMRTQGRMKRNVTVAVCSKGYHRTGIMCDIVQHALFIPVLAGHLRFHKSLDLLEKTINYKFKNRYLLQLALTHPSYKENYGTNPDHARNSLTNCGIRQPEYGDRKIHYMNTRKRGINTLINIMSRFGKEYETMSNITHNERLEFLGDAVVEFLSSIYLFFMFPELEEGGLATYRAAIVQNQHLALLAKKLNLEEYMLYAHGSDLCHELELRHAMANCFEALMGALLLDGGITVADEVFMNALFMEDDQLRNIWKNYPEHPLQEQEPLGDRAYIASYPVLQELTKFEDSIGVTFKHIRLLARAFTDRSIGFTHLTLGSNQRLEFLGDTVLQLICSEYLYRHFPEHHEGHLSLLRSSLVNNRTQAVVCDDLGMTKFAVFSNPKAELKTKDRADLLEAFLGSLYVDKGLLYCEQFCHVCLFPRLQIFIMNQDWNDPKSKLQQCCLTLRTMDGGEPDIPIYKVIESSGPTNTRVYTVAVYFRNKRLATATGSSIQQAEMNAAKQALENSRDLFPQLDHQKRIIAKSIKRQTGSELKLEAESYPKEYTKSIITQPMEDESHLPKQYRLREDISSDELPEDENENDSTNRKDCVNYELCDVSSSSRHHISYKRKYSSTKEQQQYLQTDSSFDNKQQQQQLNVCENVSSDETDFDSTSQYSSTLLKSCLKRQEGEPKLSWSFNDIKDLVEDISSSSDLEPGELCN